jgi:hypothetical protein
MNEQDYAEKVVNNFITDITDHVFLSIERDDELLREYTENAGRYVQDEVNKAIGKKVRELLNLQNNGENNNPKSRLIKTYTRHSITPAQGGQ